MVVIPDGDDPRHFAEHGQKAEIVRKYSLLDIAVGRGNMRRTLYYKAGYLIDFPRNVAGFTDEPDPVHQTQVFQRALKSQAYFKSTHSSGPPMAKVVPWQEFEQFLQDNPRAEDLAEETLLLW